MGEGGDGFGAVAELIFHIRAEFGECFFMAVRDEERVVSEALGAGRGGGDGALDAAAEDGDFFSIFCED